MRSKEGSKLKVGDIVEEKATGKKGKVISISERIPEAQVVARFKDGGAVCCGIEQFKVEFKVIKKLKEVR